MSDSKISQGWADYYRATLDRPPRDTLMRALVAFDADLIGRSADQRFAIDLGCGNGVDTIEIIRRGWIVLATDREPGAIEWVKQRVPIEQHHLLLTQVTSLEEIQLPTADLINASFSLPFCQPQPFVGLWQQIVAALRSGARFSGNFFGDRDGWAHHTDMTFHTVDQAKQALSAFEVEYFLEEESDGVTALGDPKHWHTFSIVARKI
jgi:SAM-dependent methyltransferase